MKNKKHFIIFLAFSILSHVCNASMSQSERDNILKRKTFTTVAEKIDLCRALGIEYSQEVTMSPELRRTITTLLVSKAGREALANNQDYQSETTKENNAYTHQVQYPNRTLGTPLEYITQHRSSDGSMVIKKINDTVGYGVFAGYDLPAKCTLGLYAGELQETSSLQNNNDDGSYVYGSTQSIIPGCPALCTNARNKRNELGFINGSIHHANCIAGDTLKTDGTYHTYYKTARAIKKNEQLLVDYGPEYWTSHRQNEYQELSNTSSSSSNSKNK